MCYLVPTEMEELQPAASPEETQPTSLVPTQYKDRRTWLVLFGIVELLIAMFLGFMAALMMALPRVLGTQPLPPELPHNFWSLLAATYLLGGLLFVAGGIGSILAKNWARLLMLFLSWFWLVCGIFGAIVQVFILLAGRNFQSGQLQNQRVSPQFLHVVQAFTSIFIFSIFVLIPLVFVIFYTRKSVKATCQRSMTIAQRTQALPAAIVVLLVFLGLRIVGLLSAATFFPLFAFFGFYLSGWLARAILIILAIIWTGLAWMCYRRDLQGWWAVMIASIVFGISGLLTSLLRPADEAYRLLNIPKPPPSPLMSFYSSLAFRVGFGALFLLAYFGFLLYTKRYFPQKVDASSQPLVLS